MSDRRKEILNRFIFKMDEREVVREDDALDAMDDYMKECILEFIEYVAKNKIDINNDNGEACCYLSNGEGITPKQLFENFL